MKARPRVVRERRKAPQHGGHPPIAPGAPGGTEAGELALPHERDESITGQTHVEVPAVMRQAYDATRRGGTTCVVGVGAMDKEVSFNGFELFFSEKTFMGSYYGSVDVRSDFHKLLRLWKAGQLNLEGMITTKMKLDDINDAFDAMKRGEVIRTVITF